MTSDAPSTSRPALDIRWMIGFLVILAVFVGCAVRRPALRVGISARMPAVPAPTVVPVAAPIPIVMGPRLDHALHADLDMECTDCHEVDEETGEPSMPDFPLCWDCHEDMEEEYPAEKQVAKVYFDADRKPLWTRALRSYGDETLFSHKPHAAKEIPCGKCHGTMELVSGGRRGGFLQTMDACMQCHTETQAPNDCKSCHPRLGPEGAPSSHADSAAWRLQHGAVSQHQRHVATENRCDLCHKEPDDCIQCHLRTPPQSHAHAAHWQRLHGRDVYQRGGGMPARCSMCHVQRNFCDTCHQEAKPNDHNQLWRFRHGRLVRANGGSMPARCTLCHSNRSFCDRCHMDESPRDHTTLFRTRTHGVMASIDRRRCQTCHLTDFCIRCHEDTAPRSHRGQWAARRNTHCVQCHFPISQTRGCQTCHRTNPAHATAPPQPPATHVPGRNCRLCHTPTGAGGARPLRHVDNGLNCELCHR